MTAKKMITSLSMALMMIGQSAQAGWIKVEEIEDRSFYIDPETIRKNGNRSTVWQLVEFRKRDKDGMMSARARHEYDCKEERVRALTISNHSGSMASGETLFSHTYTASPWSDIPPGTVSRIHMEIICAIK